MNLVVRPLEPVVHAAALAQGYTPLQARILAGRLDASMATDLKRNIHPSREDLDGPDGLPDIDVAADRIAKGVMAGEPLILMTDHDCDGGSAHALMRAALIDYMQVPPHQIASFISQRITEGYGLSDAVVDRILAAGHRSGVLVSADVGSADNARFARLRAAGIEGICTDHHEIPDEGPPEAAVATVSPTREDSRFPDRAIAGCHTAWLTMVAVRERLVQLGHLPKNTPALTELLDYSALGSVVDCMTIGRSRNNRRLVRHGLYLINERPRPCWQAFNEVTRKTSPWTAEDLSFLAGPRINSRGRLDDQMTGVRFLRAPTLEAARRLAELLERDNTTRKQIEAGMKEEAFAQARAQVAAGRAGLTIYLPDGHSATHGIVASKITSATGHPVVILSPKFGRPDLLSGSVRSVAGVHARDALQRVADAHPGIFVAMGGHKGAAGLTVPLNRLEDLADTWDAAVRADSPVLGPRHYTDGAIPPGLSLASLAEMEALAPYGREFEYPCFSQDFVIESLRTMGDGSHLRLQIRPDGGEPVAAVWFGAVRPGHALPVSSGERRTLAVTPRANTFRGETSLQLMVEAVGA